LSESNGKQEVLENIQKWSNGESIEFTMKENQYLDFQLDIKKPNQSIYSYKDKPDSIHLQHILA